MKTTILKRRSEHRVLLSSSGQMYTIYGIRILPNLLIVTVVKSWNVLETRLSSVWKVVRQSLQNQSIYCMHDSKRSMVWLAMPWRYMTDLRRLFSLRTSMRCSISTSREQPNCLVWHTHNIDLWVSNWGFGWWTFERDVHEVRWPRAEVVWNWPSTCTLCFLFAALWSEKHHIVFGRVGRNLKSSTATRIQFERCCE